MAVTMHTYKLLINGFPVYATFPDAAVQDVFLPLLARLTAMQRASGRRLIVFLAAPPAAGKSTLAAFLEQLSMSHGSLEPLQAVGIDGFHYPTAHIRCHTVCRDGIEVPMGEVKGCPESYDVEKLLDAFTSLKERNILWPAYDRRLHDVVEGAIDVRRNIVLAEGNWLLLEEGPWAGLRALCGFSIMVRANEALLRTRLIARKMQGGLNREEAERFYQNSDGPNIARCLCGSAHADMVLTLADDGSYQLDPIARASFQGYTK